MRRTIRLAAATLLVAAVALPASAQVPGGTGQPLCATEGASAPVADAPTYDPATLRVGTYNLLHTQGDLDDASIDARIDGQIATLLASRADVVGFQEAIETANHGNALQRIASGLADTTGQDWHWCWFQSNPKWPGEPDQQPGGGGGDATEQMAARARDGESNWSEGVGVVSRYPILDGAVQRLSSRNFEAAFCELFDDFCYLQSQFDSRQAHWVRVDTPWGGLDLVSTHIANAISSQSDRTKQSHIEEGLAYLDQQATDDPTPDLYVGDFNTTPDNERYAYIVDQGWIDTWVAARPSDPGATSDQEIDSPTATVDRRIDYVWMRAGQCDVAVVDATTIGDAPVPYAEGTVWPSDHYGVVTTLAIDAPCDAAPDPAPTPSSTPSAGDVAAADDVAPATLPATGAPLGALAVVALLSLTFGARLRRH